MTSMNLETLREQHTNDQLDALALGADDIADSGERELQRRDPWQRSELCRWLGAESLDGIGRLRRSVDASGYAAPVSPDAAFCAWS